ncbi:MAG: hypothetical protein HOB82_03170 [Alphaproteobacteria bacterium]|jgi:hypothetical protein|nr:hypothetical protein [Alphaproteobacteria bacterium]
MFSGNWRAFIAVGGFLAAFSVASVVLAQGANPEANQPEEIVSQEPPIGEEEDGIGAPEGEAEPSQDGAPARDPLVIEIGIEAAPGDQEAGEDGGQADPAGNEIAQADLDAQQKMALASLAQAAFTLVALFLIWRTLEATKKALVAANNTLVEAKRTTEAAKKSTEVTEKTAMLQLRAYVGVARGVLQGWDDGFPRVAVYFKNYGQTPAIDVQLASRLVVSEPPDGEDLTIDEADETKWPMRNYGPIQPTQELEVPHVIPGEWRGKAEFLMGENPRAKIYIYGLVRYMAFEFEMRGTAFCLELNTISGVPGAKTRPSERGVNNST